MVVVEVRDDDLTSELTSLPLDRGEKQTLYVGIHDKADLVLFDDLKAREEALAS